SHNLRAELFDALKDFEADPEVKVIIIRGSGRAFSAGYDLSGISETPDDRDYVDRRSGLPNVGPIHPGQGQWPQHLLSGYWIIWELAKPVIAQVHGYCLAGGTELASMCDLMFVAEDAIIGYPPVRAMTSVDILYHPWHLHQRKVRELLYTGDSVTGQEAVELGWANRAYPIEQLAEATEAFAERIANLDSALLQMTKRQINRAYEIMGIRTALAVGGDIQELSRVRPGGGEFGRIAREKGLKAALEWRDGPFGDYGSAPPDAPRPAAAPW
ncbi:MAG: enoyl-CoA hydratase-related protein, partial [Chloroflexota bacterium]|nr:enoyl-CoA hydratase-related protein [Dehalococcoidia bacterium]MDW8047242.1 enoyl-CoA hydratase-related protein [Chloroflexota bacterium]